MNITKISITNDFKEKHNSFKAEMSENGLNLNINLSLNGGCNLDAYAYGATEEEAIKNLTDILSEVANKLKNSELIKQGLT